MAELKFDAQSEDELREVLALGTHGTDLDELCDRPFRARGRRGRKSRFSDGSFGVFYSSLDTATAEAEMRHWFPHYVRQPQNSRTAHYHRFSCTFDGIEKDLLPKIEEWPDLAHVSDHILCNQLGAEARQLRIDGLVTPSARYSGTNLPVFSRDAIDEAEVHGMVALKCDPDSGTVTVVNKPISP